MAWFSKVFGSDEKSGESKLPASVTSLAQSSSKPEPVEEPPPPRAVVDAPLRHEAEAADAPGEKIRIKARIDDRTGEIVFMIDRLLMEGHSFWCPNRDAAYTYAPLAGAIFDAGGVSSVLIHNANITVTRDGTGTADDEAFARELGKVVRGHLESGMPVVLPEIIEAIPPAEVIREKLQDILDEDINPGIAAHEGVIILNRVEGNTAYITMGGGCQGCAASSLTLRSGVEQAFRQAVPFLGALLDETDHTAGLNPYFRSLPAGMR